MVKSYEVETESGVMVVHKMYGLMDISPDKERRAAIGGFPIAMALFTDGVIVDDTAPVETAFGRTNPAAQLKKGDFIIELNGKKVRESRDIERIILAKVGEANGLIDVENAVGVGSLINDNDNIAIGSISEYAVGKKDGKGGDKSKNGNKVKDGKSDDKGGKNSVLEGDWTILTGGSMSIKILRGGEEKTLDISPAKEEFSNKYRLGLVVRDYLLGVGMVTYVNGDGTFGALGHPISDSTAGKVPIRSGVVYNCEQIGITKGQRGTPGELRVKIDASRKPIGEIYKSTDSGVYGKFFGERSELKNYPIASRRQVKAGDAHIFTTVSGTGEYYKVEIIRAISQTDNADKGLILRAADPRLLELTGGIVQGMSGSPIIQNDRIIGAVTHVFVNDPTKGYGVYIDFMYEK